MPTVTFRPTKDLVLAKSSPDYNFNAIGLRTGVQSSSEIYRSLLHFDLSTMPDYAALTSAQLAINCLTAGLLDVEARMHRLTRDDWVEGVIGVSGATWNDYDGTNAWASAGGDYAENPNVLWYQPSSTGVVTITGANVLALVNDALNVRAGQLHLLLKQTAEGAAVGYYVYSDREYEDLVGGAYPELSIVYTAAAAQLPISEPTTVPGAARPAAAAAAGAPARPARSST